MLKIKQNDKKFWDGVFSLDKWPEFIFAHAKIIDRRLIKRLGKIAKALARCPNDSIPKALTVWSQIKATYNFLGNEKVNYKRILEPVAKSTAQLCLNQDVVLNVQDTSSISFPNALETTGLGPIYGENTRGLMFHTSLAVSETGVPMGLFGIQIWARKYEEFGKKKDRKKKDIDEKESRKWLVGINSARDAMRYISPIKKVRVIHVGDREEDIFEVLSEILSSGEGCVIRSAYNRQVFTKKGEGVKAHGYVHSQKPIGEFCVEVPRKEDKDERIASLTLRSCSVYLDCEKKKKINLVEVLEENPPADVEEPLKWYLWTTEAVDNDGAIIRVIKIYKLRWLIEEYHNILKSGCRVEKLQLKTAEQIMNAVSIYATVAIRILQLKKLAQTEPETPCTKVVTTDEWEALYSFWNKKRPDATTPLPTISQTMMWIGRLGGHIGRKSDGLPGNRTLWRGMGRLADMSDLYKVLRI
jgi:hypothetical protein